MPICPLTPFQCQLSSQPASGAAWRHAAARHRRCDVTVQPRSLGRVQWHIAAHLAFNQKFYASCFPAGFFFSGKIWGKFHYSVFFRKCIRCLHRPKGRIAILMPLDIDAVTKADVGLYNFVYAMRSDIFSGNFASACSGIIAPDKKRFIRNIK